MGLLEYHAVPSLRDVAHDGWLCTFTKQQLLEIQLAARQLLLGLPVRCGKGRPYGTSITYKITPAGSLPSSQAGRPPCWASLLAFGLIGTDKCHAANHPPPSRSIEMTVISGSFCLSIVEIRIKKMFKTKTRDEKIRDVSDCFVLASLKGEYLEME
jgi:hypothetical protein